MTSRACAPSRQSSALHGWEPIYLAHTPGTWAHAALFDALAAFARGSFARFGAETLLRGPAIVVRALAALLIPGSVLLASASASWFPRAWVRTAWVSFDVFVAIALVRARVAMAVVARQDACGRRHD